MLRLGILCIMMLLGIFGYSQEIVEKSFILGDKKYTRVYVWENGELRRATFSEEERYKKNKRIGFGGTIRYSSRNNYTVGDSYSYDKGDYEGIEDRVSYIDIKEIGISIDNKVVCNIYNAMRGYYKELYGIYLPVGYYSDTMYYPVHIEFKGGRIVKGRGIDLLGDESGVLGDFRGVYIRLFSKDIMDWYGGSKVKDNIWYSYYLKSGYNSDAGYYLSLVIMHEIFHSFGLSDTDAGIMKGVKRNDYVDGRYNKTSWEEIEVTIWEIEEDLLSYYLGKINSDKWYNLSFSNVNGVSPKSGDTLCNKIIDKGYKFILK